MKEGKRKKREIKEGKRKEWTEGRKKGGKGVRPDRKKEDINQYFIG